MINWIRLKWYEYQEKQQRLYEAKLLTRIQHLQNTLWVIEQMKKEGRI